MNDYVLRDLNARDPYADPPKDLMLEDTKVVVQSIWRLLTTEEGEIPYFRNYGINVKQFLQMPLTGDLIKNIHEYVLGKIKNFEAKGEVVNTNIDASIELGQIYYTFYIKVVDTNEVVAIPTWTVQVSTT